MPSPGGRWPEGPDEGWGALSMLLCRYSVHTVPHQSALRAASFPQGKPFGPMRIRTILQVLMAVSIDCTPSKAPANKFDVILTGGAYHSARIVTQCEWKSGQISFSPESHCGISPAPPRTLFSPIFSLAREKIGPPEAASGIVYCLIFNVYRRSISSWHTSLTASTSCVRCT